MPQPIENELSVKDRVSNEGTTRYTRVVVHPDDENAASTSLLTDEEEKKEEQSQIVIHDTRGQIWMDEREMAQLDMIIRGKVANRSLVE